MGTFYHLEYQNIESDDVAKLSNEEQELLDELDMESSGLEVYVKELENVIADNNVKAIDDFLSFVDYYSSFYDADNYFSTVFDEDEEYEASESESEPAWCDADKGQTAVTALIQYLNDNQEQVEYSDSIIKQLTELNKLLPLLAKLEKKWCIRAYHNY